MFTRLHTYQLFLSDFNETWSFSTVSEKPNNQISSKSTQREQRFSMRTNEQTDNTKLIVAFRNSANAPKNGEPYLLNMLPSKAQKGPHRNI